MFMSLSISSESVALDIDWSDLFFKLGNIEDFQLVKSEIFKSFYESVVLMLMIS